MIAYWFRVLKDDGSPNNWVGLAVAHDMRELFWEINQFCDPKSILIKEIAKGGSFCALTNTEDEEEDLIEEVEVTDSLPCWGKEGWFRPKW